MTVIHLPTVLWNRFSSEFKTQERGEGNGTMRKICDPYLKVKILFNCRI